MMVGKLLEIQSIETVCPFTPGHADPDCSRYLDRRHSKESKLATFFWEACCSFQWRKMVLKLGIHSDLAFPKFFSIPTTCCGSAASSMGSPSRQAIWARSSRRPKQLMRWWETQDIQVRLADPKSNDIKWLNKLPHMWFLKCSRSQDILSPANVRVSTSGIQYSVVHSRWLDRVYVVAREC